MPALAAMRHGDSGLIDIQRRRLACCWLRRQRQRGGQRPLVPGDAPVSFRPGRRCTLMHGNIQPALARQVFRWRDANTLRALRRNIQRHFALRHYFTLLLDAPAQQFVIAAAKQVVAADGKVPGIVGVGRKLVELLRALRFKQRRMRRAISKHQAVHAKLSVVGFVAEITAVGLPGLPVFVIARQALIDPVPDEAALQAWKLVKRLPVFCKAAQAVTHSVRVFAQDQRPVFARQADPLLQRPFRYSREGLIFIDAGIHRTKNIGRRTVSAPAFILHGASRIGAFHPAIERIVRAAVSRLIAQRPDDNAAVIAIALHHTRHALAKGGEPARIVRQTAHWLHAVGFNIGFIDHIKAVAVAQAIPEGMVRIVRAAHRVKVMLLHQFDVAPHQRLIHNLAFLWMMLVAVYAAYQQRLPVQAEQTIFDGDAAEADIIRLDLHHLALRIEQRQRGAIEGRDFGAPQRGRVNVQPQFGAIAIVATFVNYGAAKRLLDNAHLRAIPPQRQP